MVDYRTYRRIHPEAPVIVFESGEGPFISHLDRRPHMLELDSVPTEDDFYMMPPNVHGFVIQEKKWGELMQNFTSSMICN